ncbi:MAG: alanine racemase [Actinomycetota bacterium]|nr:alanine racemase [Actinomycetota bacterium]
MAESFHTEGEHSEMFFRPLFAKIDLSRIERNVRYLKGLTSPGCKFMAVVKSDAYGHGDVEVAKAALDAGADCLGVALVEEAQNLVRAGIGPPIFLLFEPPPSSADEVVSLGLTSSVCTKGYALALSKAASRMGCEIGVHLKVDTGMRRVGIEVSEVTQFVEFLQSLKGVRVEGIYTHFAMAHQPESDFTSRQMALFEAASSEAEKVLGKKLVKHAANSAALLCFPASHYDMVRVGISMYGLPPSPALARHCRSLEPALSLEGRVSCVKEVGAGEGISYGLTYAPREGTRIAVIPIGYGDGFRRSLSEKGEVLIKGMRRRVAGTICMDLSMIDVGDAAVEAGTRFVIIGKDDNEEITADEIAQKIGTINYEVLCMIGKRVPRIYVR